MSLSTTSAHLLGLTYAGVYVGSLYVSKYGRTVFTSVTRPGREGTRGEQEEEKRRVSVQERSRDDPTVIRARLTAVSFATLGCLVLACVIVAQVEYGSLGWHSLQTSVTDASVLLGLRLPPFNLSSLLPHFVIPALFLGPLTALFIDSLPGSHTFRSGNLQPFLTDPFSLISIRNYIIAPITEELVFRSCILSTYLFAFSSTPSLTSTKIIFLSPLHFGLAHLHHAWEAYNRFGRTRAALKRAVLQSTFQMVYTTVFGSLCAFLWLRGVPSLSESARTVYSSRAPSVYAPITAHIFCNLMGFPDFSGDIYRARARLGPIGGVLVRIAYLGGVGLFGWAVWSEKGRGLW
ncbi:CAAX prenyl protease [Stygiomarasmius scandens]|uniref:intramembrane prenyl-peptidase Rce1 n=1 Tax=Marasmiellus scandens TaxID=2682957 RepID=A0ABR1JVJ6_9AGAR